MTETYRIRDGARLVTFNGDVLAEVSSHRPSSPRWTELTLYVTDSGRYVLSKVGRSQVLHQPGCSLVQSKLNRFVDENPNTEADESAGWEFHSCIPDEYDLDVILVEETRRWAVVADEAREIVEHLQKRDGGVIFMPRMAVNLLEQASMVDTAIADAFLVETVV